MGVNQTTYAQDTRDVGATAQLFLDDAIVETMKGLKRQLHRPKKMGLIREADGRAWELGDQISVVRDRAGRFHLTYRFHWWDSSVRDLHSSIGEDKAHWFRETVGYAISDDGVHWRKPILGLVDAPTGFRPAPQEKWKDGMFHEPTGISRQNNLGCPIYHIQDLSAFGGVSDSKRRYLINVLKRNDTHPFAEITDGGGLYFAPDVPDFLNDADWRKRTEVVWEGKRRGPRSWATRVAGYDCSLAPWGRRCWFECAQSSFGAFRQRGGRDISRWTSHNLRDWSAEELVLPIPDDESRKSDDWIEYMDIRVVRVSDFWLGQLIIFHGDRTSPQGEMLTAPGVWRKGTTEMRLVMSRDAGKTWQRVGGKEVWLPHHEEEDGFDRLVFTGSPVRVGDELWLYYGCWDGDHLTWNRDGTTFYKHRMRIGRTARAVLRWDGYVSLRGESVAGEVVTKPLTVSGRKLTVNAAATNGSVRVEVQDINGKPLPGFALADCVRLTGNGVSQLVRWRGGDELPKEKPLRLRFEVQRADLFGFRFEG